MRALYRNRLRAVTFYVKLIRFHNGVMRSRKIFEPLAGGFGSSREAGLSRSSRLAATQAGIENYSIIGYPEKENIFASLLGNQKKHYINSEIKEYLGSYYNSFKALENIKDANCIQARMPFDPNIQ